MWRLAEKQGCDFKKISGTLQNDILKEYIAQKEWIYPIKPAMKLVIDTFEFCTQHVPKYNPISVSGYHIREAGATALQELAFTLRDGVEYVKYGVERGMDVDEFVPRISFFFNSHNDFFEEIAKFRAARVIWAQTMKERFGAKNPRTMQLSFHTQTAGVSLDFAAAFEQYRQSCDSGTRRSFGRHAEFAHRFIRRSTRIAIRSSRVNRFANTANHRRRNRRGEHG